MCEVFVGHVCLDLQVRGSYEDIDDRMVCGVCSVKACIPSSVWFGGGEEEHIAGCSDSEKFGGLPTLPIFS